MLDGFFRIIRLSISSAVTCGKNAAIARILIHLIFHLGFVQVRDAQGFLHLRDGFGYVRSSDRIGFLVLRHGLLHVAHIRVELGE